ncbi:MAG: hypothetical protein HF314_13690 [Ignavibacteria bacterium]|jgi:hypothetical protein|nr:hypothetical protein [Ignavibacteria bacterium]MCU7504130.1 hypothetical protein [Ignavibacteria bacterium]MCU7516420.1 hypothetical protein [Ignavibacteria bacterium]
MEPVPAKPKTKAKPKKSAFRKVVNIFLYFFIGLSVFMVLFMGFTQTKTFRELLRKEVISEVNKSINGKLNIEAIDGTIFTSLTLRNTSLLVEGDTLLYANRLAIKTSPLQILLKKIYVRSIELSDARINLIKDSLGVYNFSKLSKKPPEEDTTKSSFPFTITVADLKLNNISFRHALFENRHSLKSYPMLNMNDLRVDSFYLALDAFADIDNNNFQVRLSGAKAKVNLQNFRLRDLRGNFYLTDHNAKVDYLVVKSNTSDFDLYASLDKVNFFKEFRMSNLKDAPVNLELNARVFDFADLASFATTDFLKGTLKTKLKLAGTYGNIMLERLSLDYRQTHLNATGEIKNLHEPKNMLIKAAIKDGYINEPDLAELMPGQKFPVYKNLQVKNINIGYEGDLKSFKASLKADLPEGSIASKAELDYSSPMLKYNVDLETSKLNLEPIINTSTYLNTFASIKGEGTKPELMNMQAQIRLLDSKFKEYTVDSLRLNTVANAGRIIMRINSLARNAGLNMDANLDYRDKNNPVYEMTGSVSNLDIRKFTADTSLSTNLNFTFGLKGKSFDFHKMESEFNLALAQSAFKNKTIKPLNISLVYTKPSPAERLIKITSDVADLNVWGNYSIDDAAALLGYEYKIISQSTLKKAYEFNPVALFNDSLKAKEFEAQLKLDETKIPKIIRNDMIINYSLNIKDFALISSLMDINKINMDGTIGGRITNDATNFTASSYINLNYLKIFTPSNLVYISDLAFDVNVSRDNREVSFSNMGARLNLSTSRIFSGTDLKNIGVHLSLENNALKYNFAADMDTTLKARIAGSGDIANNQFKFVVDTLSVDYKNLTLNNDSALVATYTKEAFEIQHFALRRNGSKINLSGALLGDGSMRNLSLKVDNLGTDILKELGGIKNDISASLSMSATANGYLDKPEIKLNLLVNDIKTAKVNLGNLQCDLDYAPKLLKANVVFLDSVKNTSSPLLTMTGSIPVDLGFMNVKDRIVTGQPVSLSLKSTNFDLTPLGALASAYIGNLSGTMNADLNVGGTMDRFIYGGQLALSNTNFLLKQNNLNYALDMNLSLANETVTIENLALKNAGQTQHPGTLKGTGKINFAGTKLDNIDATISGNLAVLGPNSKAVLPAYGDLVLQSDGNWRFTYNGGSSDFSGKVLLKNTDVTFVPPSSSYGQDNKNDFVYHYVIDSSKIDKKQADFNQIVALSQKYSPTGKTKLKTASTDFSYDLNIKIDDEAKVVVVIYPEFNQQLTAILDGDLTYGSNGVAQGEFKLLEGSTLSFFQTFTVTGTVYFESDLTNPRMDLVATYVGDHNAPVDSGKIAVKIKLKGSREDIAKSLAQNSENIGVYVGDENIENDVASPKYNTADAISFLISGKFPNELTANDQTKQGDALANYTNKLTGYGYSIASSLISSYANSQLGDVVKSIELEQRGSQYQFGISGKVENLRYSIGGTTEALQDFTKANLKFEYPFSEYFLMRFERKDPIIQTTGINEKINELGLRYKFIF